MKSHVSMEQHVCLVCGHTFDTGSILLDRRLRDSLEPKTVTGWDLCPEHKALYESGMIALVECDPTRGASGAAFNAQTMKPEDVWRTGRLMHIKEEAFKRMFNIPSRRANGTMHAVMWIDPQAFDHLAKLAEGADRG